MKARTNRALVHPYDRRDFFQLEPLEIVQHDDGALRGNDLRERAVQAHRAFGLEGSLLDVAVRRDGLRPFRVDVSAELESARPAKPPAVVIENRAIGNRVDPGRELRTPFETIERFERAF